MAVRLKTYGERLGEVQNAISKVLLNQRYEMDGRSFWKADIASLYEMEKYLIDKMGTHGDVIPSAGVTGRGYEVSFGG